MTDKEVDLVPSSHPNKVRMLVLETDDLHPASSEPSGVGQVLAQLFKDAGDQHEPTLGIETMIRYIIEDKGGRVPSPEEIGDDIHAILITGSMYDAYGEDEWIMKLLDLLRHLWLHRPDIRFSGICFGHQILCRVLGSPIAPEPSGEWEISHNPIFLTDVGRKLFNMPPDQDRIYLHQMHLDSVIEAPTADTDENRDLLPAGTKVHVWGTSEHTGVQGCYVHKRLFTSQGHLELSGQRVVQQLEKRVKAGSLDEEDADEAAEKADWMHDGLLVAKAVLRFFHGDDDQFE
ncbi:class I glutamine amidotransferase-like protein [Xylariaceae sp. FL0594]|nr:class I glutamine amidotransferase-like protein [Xylariaceae sp. FL0594]